MSDVPRETELHGCQILHLNFTVLSLTPHKSAGNSCDMASP